jgi:hypothetical protein
VALETQSQARATISLHNIQQIKPVYGTSGQVLASNGVGQSYFTFAPTSNLSVGTFVPNNNITFNSQQNKPVLVITGNGDVEWHGKPSEAADCLVRTFQFAVEEKKGVTKAARRRYYYRAVNNLAKKSRTMSAEQFVDFVQKQAYTRERKVILDSLRGEHVDS